MRRRGGPASPWSRSSTSARRSIPSAYRNGRRSAMKEHINRLPHYPEPYSEGLAAHIGKQLGCGGEAIICGNGSTEMIYLIPRALRPARVLIPAPTFGEYERACTSSGASEVAACRLRREDAFDVDPELFIGSMSGRAGQQPRVRVGLLQGA